jgi:cobalt-zinc-cadmium resistance protein CzcA
MIHHIVQFALKQRFLVLMLAVFIVIAGAVSFQRMPVDAYPDLSPPLVEVITQWPGHAAEEIERLVTLPIELQMNGVPHMVFMRSISLYGLSDVIMTFQESTDDYFARQVVFERLSDGHAASGSNGQPGASVEPVKSRLSLRDREPGPDAARAEDVRGLGN